MCNRKHQKWTTHCCKTLKRPENTWCSQIYTVCYWTLPMNTGDPQVICKGDHSSLNQSCTLSRHGHKQTFPEARQQLAQTLLQMLMRSSWILKRKMQWAERSSHWTMSPFLFSRFIATALWGCNTSKPLIKRLGAHMGKDQACREHGAAQLVAPFLAHDRPPPQTFMCMLITPQSYFKEVKTPEIRDSSNGFLSSHPAHAKRNEKWAEAAHKINKHLTHTAKESTSWLWGWGSWVSVH